MKKLQLIVSFLVAAMPAYSQNWELPLSSTFDYHSGYSFEYSHEFKQSKWVAYKLIGSNALKKTQPEVQFFNDPKLPAGALNSEDFYQRVYPPGHLKPSGDSRSDVNEMHDSYYYANVCPMQPTFDQENWRILENMVRGWSQIFDTIYVVSGPAFKKTSDSVGIHKVAVPDYFYKVLLVHNGIDMQMIGFVLPNIDVRYDYLKTPVSVDSIERLTGIDFFYQLPEYLEQDLEKQVNTSFWTGGSNSYYLKNKMRRKEIQCIGTTVMDKRCLALTKCLNGCCSQHGCEGE
ncbi:MAG: DNA/RNA non-specific endonuclease [Bacteroidetes bacterium]|nr:DNA/RNA non-specific endonuclease [Bacteroidota bacterium]